MPVATLNCPMCGAPSSSDSPLCLHCGARLAKVACPACFGMMFEGAKFCSHCGARMDRTEINTASPGHCPRCNVTMEKVSVGATQLGECPKCAGLWVDRVALERICSEREQQSAALDLACQGRDLPSPARLIETRVRYLPCPVCQKLMNRINFAGYSNVIVDICKAHGTWFDRDELRRVIEFIRSGGLDTARQRELAELESRRRQLKDMQLAGTGNVHSRREELLLEHHSGISLISDALSDLFR